MFHQPDLTTINRHLDELRSQQADQRLAREIRRASPSTERSAGRAFARIRRILGGELEMGSIVPPLRDYPSRP